MEPDTSTTKPRPSAPRAWPYAALAIAALGLTLAVGWGILAVDRSNGASTAESTVPATSVAPDSSGPSAVAGPRPGPSSAAAPAVASAPSPVASVASASATPQRVDLEGRTTLRRTAAGHDWAHATDAFFALVDHDRAAFHDPLVIVAARDVAAAAGVTSGDVADRVFEALELRLGSDGIDVLYEIVRTRGGSKAAVRAQNLLGRADVMAHASPELRITFALREAPCADKPGLLTRAAAEGDGRTLLVMETVGAACLGKSQALADAERALTQRLRAR